MSYTPTTWAAGDTVTAAKLNKLEQGVAAGGVLVVHIDEEYTTLDKTWQEIHDALAQGIPCVTVFTENNDVEQGQIVFVSASAGIYYVYALSVQGTTPVALNWTATSAGGYPTYNEGDRA